MTQLKVAGIWLVGLAMLLAGCGVAASPTGADVEEAPAQIETQIEAESQTEVVEEAEVETAVEEDVVSENVVSEDVVEEEMAEDEVEVTEEAEVEVMQEEEPTEMGEDVAEEAMVEDEMDDTAMEEEVAMEEPSGPTPQQQALLDRMTVIGQPPELHNETWLNSEQLKLAELDGKVVLVEFWTFG